MPNTTPKYRLPYPLLEEGPNGPVAMQALAEKLEQVIADIDRRTYENAGGAVIVQMTDANSTSKAITFPEGAFGVPPICTAVVASRSALVIAGIGDITKNGMTITVFRKDENKWNANVAVHWTATEYV